ncbi:MAG: hypothetical protein HKO57_11720 [Akkermansiaceae bacterium]|nr:hypothetical protein [Akkermansiaceae bacterium]
MNAARTILMAAATAGGFADAVAAEAPDYHRDIAPLVRQYCAGCHNDLDFKGDVTLERFADLEDGGFGSGTMLKPGDPEGSELVRLITGRAKEPMPPADEPQLQPAEIEVIKRWIAAGARGPQGEEDVSILSTLEVPGIAAAPGDRAVTAADVSHDGKWLATARFGVAEVRPNGGAGEGMPRLVHPPGKVNAVHFAPGDASRLVTASGITGLNGIATVWDLRSGEAVAALGDGYHRDVLYDAEFSPDGTLLATAGYDAKIAIWEVASGKRLRGIEVHTAAVFDLAFSPDGEILASASADETVKLWQVATGRRLDTLSQPQGEQFSVEFTPDGKFVLAAGADNRIRMWRLVGSDHPRINPLRHARFAHEDAIVKLAVSRDGRLLASSGDDRAVKLWSLPGLEAVHVWGEQPDVAPVLAFTGKGGLLAGRMDGSRRRLVVPKESGPEPTAGLSRAPDQAEAARPPAAAVTKVTETEGPGAMAVDLPAEISGTIAPAGDRDDFRFAAKAGERWVLEVNAARMKSPLDSKVEVLTADGKPIERVKLQAVRDSWFEFRGKNSTQANDFRVFNWREMELNDYLYCNGEVVKLWLYPRGPDSGFNVYPGFGTRHTWFGTSALAHALGEPCYIVKPLPPGADPQPNGLPVFTIHYENDDDPQRRLGSDSKLTFTAPADGEYIARLSDVRGFGGEKSQYTLTIRPPRPDFKVTVEPSKGLTLVRGSAKEFVLSAQRFDGFDGEIHIDVSGLPAGVAASGPIVIESGQQRAMGVLMVEPDAPAIEAGIAKAARLRASATIAGARVTRDIGSFGKLEIAGEPAKLLVEILPDADSGAPRVSEEGVLELTIQPGETITALVRAERRDLKGNIAFGNEDAGRNLAHGLIIDNIGLSGLMIPAGKNERRFFITAAEWVSGSTRPFHLRTGAGGGHAARPIVLHVAKPSPGERRPPAPNR